MNLETENYLRTNHSWSSEQIKLGIRAKCKCEYCDKDLFDSADNYMTWQVDHIIPKSSKIPDFEYEAFDNLAITCKQCNFNFKNKYNPANEIGYGKSREEYIFVTRKYIQNKRKAKELTLVEMREIFGKYI